MVDAEEEYQLSKGPLHEGRETFQRNGTVRIPEAPSADACDDVAVQIRVAVFHSFVGRSPWSLVPLSWWKAWKLHVIGAKYHTDNVG